MLKASELLADARDHLADGWVQGSYRNGEGVCMMGALDRAVMQNLNQGGVQVHKEAKTALEAKCREVFDGSHSIPNANDSWRTTKDDVLNAMDKAVIGLEEVGR